MKKFLFTVFLTLSFLKPAWSQEEASSVILEREPASDRLISSPTAFSSKDGVSATAHLHTFFGFAYTVGGAVRWTKKAAEKVHVGVGSNLGFMFTPLADTVPFFYGAGPVVTFGDSKLLFNLSTLVYGAHADDEFTWLVMPSAGVSGKVTEKIRLHAEVIVPILKEQYESIKFGTAMYGVRFGKKIYVDANFILPFGGDTAEVYTIFPIGIPVFSLGVGF